MFFFVCFAFIWEISRTPSRLTFSPLNFRRKPGRHSNHNKHVPPTAETSLVCDDDQHYSSKGYPPTAHKSSSTTQKFPMRSIGSSNHLISDDHPPALPPRKPLEKKNSIQTPSNPLDETMLAPSRILPNREVRWSQVIVRFHLDMDMWLSLTLSFSRVCIVFNFRFVSFRILSIEEEEGEKRTRGARERDAHADTRLHSFFFSFVWSCLTDWKRFILFEQFDDRFRWYATYQIKHINTFFIFSFSHRPLSSMYADKSI